MIRCFVHADGATREAAQVDPAWLAPDSGVFVWAEIQTPDEADARVLHEVFGFHALAFEDAMEATHHPKVESYQGYRITGILDAHLATVSNQLAQVSKLLAVVAVLFGPLTVITGFYGMNVALPVLPGGEGLQFWWVMAFMVLSSGGLFALFRRMRWL